jgi:plasmid replication initiation protein
VQFNVWFPFIFIGVIFYFQLILKEVINVDLLKWLMKPNKKIYHDNNLKPELMDMELAPRRILWLILAKLEKEGLDLIFNPDYVFIITAKEYATLCGISESVAYKQLKIGVEIIRTHLMRILEKDVLTEDEMKGKNKDRMVIFTVANHGVYSDGDGYIELKLDPIMAPYISRLKSNFTGQFLLSALRLPDSNANKIYLLLCEWISSGMSLYKEISIDELKSILVISQYKSYQKFKVFKQSFWSKSIKNLIKETEFSKIEMEIIERRGRKAYKVRISYEYTQQLDHLKQAGSVIGSKRKPKKEPVVEKTEVEPVYELEADNVETRYFKKKSKFMSRKEALNSKLDWEDGLT